MARVHATGFSHPWDESALRHLMEKPNCLALAAFASAHDLVGFIITRHAADEAEILTIATDSKKRRKGVAALLLSHALKMSHQRGSERMFLEVASGNKAALALYKKYGFEEISRRKAYYQHQSQNAEDALIMSKKLSSI